MTFEDAKKNLDAGCWITRPALAESFLSRPWAMPVGMREAFGDEGELHQVWIHSLPLVHDIEQEYSMTMAYIFTAEDERATDWAMVPMASEE